jgi:alpha-ketoglutarate-dependent sulfate ester dioxygenase
LKHEGTDPARVPARAADALVALLAGVPGSRALGVGFAAGGWVDRDSGTLWAEHTNDYDYAVPEEDVDEDQAARRAQFTSIEYRTVHPVVRVHPPPSSRLRPSRGPPSGERGLFIGGFAQRIVGLSAGESRKILGLLQAYVIRPENVLRHRWSPNQLVLFDNRITQHHAVDNYDGRPRRLHRVTVAGDMPVGIEGKESCVIEGDASHYSPVAAQPHRATRLSG